MRKRTVYFLMTALLIFGANLFVAQVESQTIPFTMRQMLNSVASIKEGRISQSKVIRDIRQRKVDFPLTKENEKLLRDEGASNALIQTIRQNSLPLPTPKPSATPSPTATSPDSEFYMKRGDEFFDKKDYPKAIKEYNEVVRLNPKNSIAYFKLGYSNFEIGEIDKAIADYSNSIDTNYPSIYAAYNNRALAYYQKKEYDKAIADFNQALQINPNYAEAYTNRGSAYYQKKDYDKAITDFNNAIAVNPNYANAYDWLGYVYEIKQDYDKALANYGKAIQVNPSYETAKNNLKRLLAELSRSKGFRNSVGMEFGFIPSGSIKIKNKTGNYTLTVAKSFRIGKTEVTQGQWKSVMGVNPSGFQTCGDNCPVENVSWDDVQQFIKKLNLKGEGIYRLPTKIEFEYAMRGEMPTLQYWGDDMTNAGEYAWYKKNAEGKTHEVGKKKPNNYGLYDIAGNVMEWCQDQAISSNDRRMVRGGSAIDEDLSSSVGYTYLQANIGNFLGFRLVYEGK